MIVGDIVITGDKKQGVVELVIQPGSQESSDYSAPEGGILIEEDWDEPQRCINRSALFGVEP